MADALSKIESTYGVLDVWKSRVASPIVPAEGSELAVDDTDRISWPVSQLAAAGLASATDHLDAIRVHVEARRLFPLATETLLRGALLGASQAVWILAPDDRLTRQRNARTLAAEVLKNHRLFLSDLRTLPAQPHEGTDRGWHHTRKREAELAKQRDALAERASFEATRVIQDAAAVTYSPSAQNEARTIWRSLSGAAHGFMWQTLGRPSTAQLGPADAAGIAAFQASGDLDDVLPGYALAFAIARKGWELVDLRSSLSGEPTTEEDGASADG